MVTLVVMSAHRRKATLGRKGAHSQSLTFEGVVGRHHQLLHHRHHSGACSAQPQSPRNLWPPGTSPAATLLDALMRKLLRKLLRKLRSSSAVFQLAARAARPRARAPLPPRYFPQTSCTRPISTFSTFVRPTRLQVARCWAPSAMVVAGCSRTLRHC
jgi:hypothetical protein